MLSVSEASLVPDSREILRFAQNDMLYALEFSSQWSQNARM